MHLIKHKSEATKFIQYFLKFIQTQFGKCIKGIHSDNAEELAPTHIKWGLSIVVSDHSSIDLLRRMHLHNYLFHK
ncbi:hypothetical protein CR513_22856, partial [Mucuna pruriens]